LFHVHADLGDQVGDGHLFDPRDEGELLVTHPALPG
jgi:hypothetical protein